MDRETLLEALVYWNKWDRDEPSGLHPRAILASFDRWMESRKVKVVKGVRRCGKSAVLHLLKERLVKAGCNRKAILYLNLEEPVFSAGKNGDVLDLLYETYREAIYPEGKAYLLVDEIQLIPEWERWVRARSEREDIRVVITGSSSKLLSKELGTLLTGRHISFELFPLSFREFLEFHNIRIGTMDTVSIIVNKRKIRGLLKQYIEYGGFPEVCLEDNEEKKKTILTHYFDDMLHRDVAERHQIRNIKTLRALAYHYLTNFSSLMSFNQLKNVLDAPIDVVRNYTTYLSEAYLVFEVPRFSWKTKEQIRYPRKIYTIDTGLRNSVAFRFSRDVGKAVENIIFMQLKRRGKNIYYWHNRHEVDFVVEDKGKLTLVNSAWEVKKRAVEGIVEAARDLGIKEGTIVTESTTKTERLKGITVNFISLWEWLLGA